MASLQGPHALRSTSGRATRVAAKKEPRMEAAAADLVYPFIEHCLRLRERLEAGAVLNIAAEQEKMKRLLEPNAAQTIPASASTKVQDLSAIRFALVCWLDELMQRTSP